ncbi:MAG: hypothetical protein Greene101449_1310 [Candidatus Peregrinibacteria bacterium Greene1014_49]|nr:MAG: hypothetical protein Greene101449_1310 [Candidatus Peregrinibacteria bacterium Greene1014_49]
MTLFKDRYRVETARLRGWNYAQQGVYFVTICTKGRAHWFGEIRRGIMGLSGVGCIVNAFWNGHHLLQISPHRCHASIVRFPDQSVRSSDNGKQHAPNAFGRWDVRILDGNRDSMIPSCKPITHWKIYGHTSKTTHECGNGIGIMCIKHANGMGRDVRFARLYKRHGTHHASIIKTSHQFFIIMRQQLRIHLPNQFHHHTNDDDQS